MRHLNIYKRLLNELLLSDGVLELPWGVQGLGMYRLKWGDLRIHIWCPNAAYSPVPSDIHSHPWSGESFVVAGSVTDYLYQPQKLRYEDDSYTHTMEMIQCGEGGGARGISHRAKLHLKNSNTMYPGDRYHLHKDLVHKSDPTPGTITLVQREKGESEAYVAVPRGEVFQSAMPRPMTKAEKHLAIGMALQSLAL